MSNGKSISVYLPDTDLYNALAADAAKFSRTVSWIAAEILRQHYSHQFHPATVTHVHHQQETVVIHRHLPQPPAPPDAPVQVDAQKKG